jgi:hypothetical protein
MSGFVPIATIAVVSVLHSIAAAFWAKWVESNAFPATKPKGLGEVPGLQDPGPCGTAIWHDPEAAHLTVAK